MASIGAFTFVLHAHIPYCRRAGRWPHGEEWLHEAIAETYLPLLDALYALHEEGIRARLTLSLTPVLAEQLADPLIQEHFIEYAQGRRSRAEQDVARFEAEGNPHLRELARFYADFYDQRLRSFTQRYGRDLIGAFRRLQEVGMVELVTSAATHGYLPLLCRDSSIRGQLRTGVQTYRRFFGRSPFSIWLPECAYRPAYRLPDGSIRPGLEHFLAQEGLRLFFAETHAVEGGRPVGKAAGDAIGPYGQIVRRYVIPFEAIEGVRGTTYRPYYVVRTDVPAGQHSGVAVVARHHRTGMQVWSADWGYPGDFDYREFHKKDGRSGLQYWRVTGKVDLGEKDYYHPDWAAAKVEQHAGHFVGLVHDLLREFGRATGQVGLIASNYDAELFGHWWFEGVDWIRAVLRRLAESEEIWLTTAREFLEAYPPTEVLALPESSWGLGGGHWTWDNPETHWMWAPIHEAEVRMERLAAQHPEADAKTTRVLNQAARELLLLQASDWPFLITTGQARAYAVERFTTHLERFEALCRSVEAGQPDEDLAEAYWELDKVFPDLDYRWWAPL
jgi:1,4-alpha-glucan branching enzyme